MTLQEIVIQYEGRILDLQTAIAQLRWPHALAAAVLAIAFGLFLALSLYAIRGQVSFLWLSLPIPVAAAFARRLRLVRQSRSRMWRLTRFYGRAVHRVKGDWVHAGFTGEEFNRPNHVYAADLNVVGEGSLFELLCIARTSIGRRGLANYLLEAPTLEETLLRQEAVRELQGRTDLRERIATLGELEFLWTHVAMWSSPLIVFHSAVGLYFRTRVNRMTDSLRPVSIETRVLREGLELLQGEQFQSAKLRQLSEQVRNASASIRKLERLLGVIEKRDKDWFYGPSRVFLAGTQLCIAAERWRRKHGQALRVWLAAWAEFEALNALAAYGYEHPDNTFPQFDDNGRASFQARDLGHPLLPHTSCVTNDIELTRESPFYIVSGSNMSGKSTLLRALGLNAVLAFAGAPVRARALRLSGLSIFASLSVVDSLLNGKSKFLAEVDRLREAIESAVPNRRVLFLVDEIFSGTNSRDRRIAAEAVVRTLVNRGAIGALSTHDLALTEIANSAGMNGTNVHMGARDPDDPMNFDYRLNPGVTTETNALAIARMAGVPV